MKHKKSLSEIGCSADQAVEIIMISLKLAWARVADWMKPNLWHMLLGLSILLIPPAKAGLYAAVADGLRDVSESSESLRSGFWRGFHKNLGRSFSLSALNLLVLLAIVISILFWSTRSQFALKLLALPGLYTIVYWWMCQPFLFPALVLNPSLPVMSLIKEIVQLVFLSPFYALTIAICNGLMNLLGWVLLGPILFVFPAWIALISIQAYWRLRGEPVLKWGDPESYNRMLDHWQVGRRR